LPCGGDMYPLNMVLTTDYTACPEIGYDRFLARCYKTMVYNEDER